MSRQIQWFKNQGIHQTESQVIQLHNDTADIQRLKNIKRMNQLSIKNYVSHQKNDYSQLIPSNKKQSIGQSHINTVALGFQFLCVKTKINNSLIKNKLIKNADCVVTMETKQLIDTLSEPNKGPTEKFKAFLLALISQLKVLLQQYITDPEVQIKLEQVPGFSSTMNSIQYFTNGPECLYNNSPLFPATQQENIGLGSQVNLHITEEPELSQQENQSQQHYNFRHLITEQLENLKQILDYFSKYTYGQFYNFFNDFEQFLNDNLVEKTQSMSAIKLFEEYIHKCINFIIQIINIKIIQSSNFIYRYINYKITGDEEIIIFSPSKLITKGLIYAKLLGKQITVTIVDTHLQHSVNQFKELSDHNIRCQYVLLTQLPVLLQSRKYLKCFMSAYTISANGNILTRAGGQMLAIFMKQAKIPLIVCAQSYKFITTCENLMETTLVSQSIGSNDIEVEIVANNLITAILHEHGLITPYSISSVDV